MPTACRIALTLLAILGLAACRSTDHPAPAPLAGNGDATIDQIAAATPPERPGRLDPNALLPRRELSGTFTRRPAAAGGEFRFTWTPGKDGWILEVEGLRRSLYRIDPGGNLIVVRDEDLAERVVVTYDPGVVIVPRDGRRVEGEAKMTVANLHSGDERDRGTVRYVTTPLGIHRIATPRGAYDAQVVRVERKIDLRLADAEVDTHVAWAPGQGVVAEHVDRTVRPLGVFRTQSRHTLERSE